MTIISELGQAVDDQLSRSITATVRRELWLAPAVDRRRWTQFADSGWFSALLPETLDGLALTASDIVDLFESIGRHLVPGPFLEHVLLAPLLVEHAVDLPEIAEFGDGRSLLSWWDPQAGGSRQGLEIDDAATVSATIDGVRFAADADYFLVVLDALPSRGSPKIALIARDASVRGEAVAGVTDPVIRPGRLVLDHTPVRVLLDGERAEGFLQSARAWCRIATAIELSGTVRWLVEQSAEFAKTRRQFGQPIGRFQALAHLIADMAVHDIALQNLWAAVVQDAATQVGGPPDFLASLGVKAYAAEIALATAETALQAHGGIGFTMEHPLHMYYKHALQLWAWYGDPTRLAIEIARTTLSGSPSGQSS